MLRLALAVLAALLLAPAADAAAAKRPCESRGITVARTLQARVYEVERRDGYRALVGCHHGTGKRRTLDTWFSCDCSVGDESPPRVAAMAGRFVAVVSSYSCGPFPCESAPGLAVMDLRSRTTLHKVPGGGAATGLLLKRNGSLAFVLGHRLTRMDRAGTAVIDEGPGIDPGSLAAGGSRLYWMHGGEPRTAPFS